MLPNFLSPKHFTPKNIEKKAAAISKEKPPKKNTIHDSIHAG